MRMFNPNAFVREFGPVNALITLSIRSHNFTSLHHKIRDNSLNLSALVVQVLSHFTSTQSPKVFYCLWKQVLKQFNNDSLLFVSLLARLSYLNVHPSLNMFKRELWHWSEFSGLLH